MPVTMRAQQFREYFPHEPTFRWKQAEHSLFDRAQKNWAAVTTLSKSLRDGLTEKIPWMSVSPALVLHSKNGDTVKAVLDVSHSGRIETVLMKNRRGQWTICVSSQVGCAMRCQFCATGKMGFFRNLTSDEIIDQYRFWNYYLSEANRHSGLTGIRSDPGQGQDDNERRISNIVFMGMGEPLANYDHVRETVNTILKYTDIGATHITVSTVGMLPQLDKLLNDPLWPHVRLAVSLHSADAVSRKAIVPTSYDDFHRRLADWSRRYLQKFGNRRHHLTFEYVMLSGVNDDDMHAKKLVKFVNSIGQIKVNLIPYNATGAAFNRSAADATEKFLQTLHNHGIIATVRKTMGDDIAAACGQLIAEQSPSP